MTAWRDWLRYLLLRTFVFDLVSALPASCPRLCLDCQLFDASAIRSAASHHGAASCLRRGLRHFQGRAFYQW
jgi:hypothetical protein